MSETGVQIKSGPFFIFDFRKEIKTKNTAQKMVQIHIILEKMTKPHKNLTKISNFDGKFQNFTKNSKILVV